MIDIATGFTGFTIDVFGGSISDNEGDVTKVLFAFTYQMRVNDVDFTITNGADHWSAMMPSGEYIGLSNPQVVFSNRDSAIVEFDMAEKYPSNTLAILAYRNIDAKFTITEIGAEPGDPEKPFIPNTIIGSMGFSSNEYGGGTDDEGQVERVVFNISFANHKNEVEFTITEDPADWAVLMGDGSYINLINPHVLFQNRDGATIVFQMTSPYPSNSPGFLVRKRKEAGYSITEIDEDHPFIPIQNIVFPSYIPAGERINLHSQVVVYPMNSTLRGIEWTLASEGVTGAVIQNGWITTANPGKITLKANVPNGAGLGNNYSQNIDVMVINNWIVIEQQPHMDMAAITGNIIEEISVIATTPSGELTYQWYKNTTASNEGGQAISGASGSIYKLPKGLIPGDFYYFCEVRKVNFPSVRTDVVKVRVRDKLIKLDIFPPAASIPPGSNQQFAVTRNPQTSDELGKVTWHSDNHSVITIDQNGLALAFNPGTAIISAIMNGVTASITANTVYTPVSYINFTLDRVLETGTTYDLPKTVSPSNASKQNIIWSVISAGTTGAMINNGKITPNNVGVMVLRGTIVNGLNPTTNFVQEFTINVVKGTIPVVDVTLASIGTPRVGEIIALQGTVIPANASNTNISWTIQDAGNTRAKIQSGNLLTLENPGRVVILATIINGRGKNSNFTKSFPIDFLDRFVAVSGIEGFPSELNYYDGGEGVTLSAYVTPENADNKTIIYTISDKDTSSISPSIVDGVLTYDSTTMTFESQETVMISMVVKNGLSNGVDYVSESSIYITNPAAPDVFVPIIDSTWKLPSILRAYRPILIDRSDITPWDATNKALNWKITREKDIGGCASLIFIPTDENHADLVANGVLFNEGFIWNENGNYIYPMSKGELKVELTVFDGLGINQPFIDTQVLDFKDPFIPIKDIKNIPTQIYNGTSFHLSPEIDTGDGMNEQTAEWDDRVSTFSKVEYAITKGMNLASINSNGVITPSNTGNIEVTLTVRSGVQETYEWYDKTFERIDFVKKYPIKIVAKEYSNNKILRIKKTGGIMNLGETIDIYSEAEFNLLRSIGSAEGTIPLRGKMVARNTITEIEFYDKFKFTDLSNFGRNFTSLKKINKIPESATNLRNFLMGCKVFNQVLTIPSGVNGPRCLEGFLRDCINFNQPIKIPRNINGDKCLESFLRGCIKFNRPIVAPVELQGDCCMYSFLHDCTALNSTVVLPKKIHGKRCMENVLRNCQSFNKNITMPEEISGNYNIAAFMYTCNNMQAKIIIPTAEFVEGSMADVITFSTFYRNSKISENGVNLVGVGADAFKTKTGDQGSATLVPIRTLKAEGGIVPDPDPIPEVVSVNVLKEVIHKEGYDDFLVGDEVGYNITVTNRSDIEVTGVSISDDIPAEILYGSTECTNPNFSLKLVRDAAPEEPEVTNPYEEWNVDVDGEPTKVTVSPASANVLPGGTAQFYAFGDDTQKVLPSGSVTWTVDSTKSTIVDGLLKLDATETDVATLTVTATMLSLNGSTVSGTASIGVIHTWTPDLGEIVSIAVTPVEVTVGTTKTHQFYVTVNEDACVILPDSDITWSVDGNDSTIENGLLTIGENETSTTLTVGALYNTVESITASATVTVTKTVLGTVRSAVLKLSKMSVGEEVSIKVITTADVVADGVTNTATMTFDQIADQETVEGNVSSAMINIVVKHNNVTPEA